MPNYALWLSLRSQKRSVGQGVKTPPFHGGITGSIPVRSTESIAFKIPIITRLGFFISLNQHNLLKYFAVPEPVPIFALPKKWSVGKSVNTPPFHGGMTGSIPVRSTGKGTIVVIIPNAEKRLGFFVAQPSEKGGIWEEKGGPGRKISYLFTN